MTVVANGLNISDNVNYLVTEVEYKNMPGRDIQTQAIGTRPGSKFLAAEWSEKEIIIKGIIFGVSYDDLVARVDTFQQNVGVQSLALQLDVNRTYTATLQNLSIPTQFFQNTMVNYEMSFLAIDPFAYGPTVTISGTVVSGTITYSGTLTISGTVFASPILTVQPLGQSAGDTGITNIQFDYLSTGEIITASGVLNYVNPISVDYNNFFVTVSGVNVDYSGIFSRWEPGQRTFTIKTTGGHPGYSYILSYAPRYYQ